MTRCCTIAAFHGQRSKLGMFDKKWFLQMTLEQREEQRNPRHGEGFLSVAGLAWSGLWLKAARRSSVVRALFRARGRIEDRRRRGDDDDRYLGEEGDDDQIAFSGWALSARYLGRDRAE